MNRKSGLTLLVLMLFFSIISAGCNKQKAESLKVAAEKFRIEAVSALDKIKDLFTQSLTMPLEGEEEQIGEIADNLEGEAMIAAEYLSSIIDETDIGEKARERVNEEFDRIEQEYYQFEAMFSSLPEGSFLAAHAVEKAEKHAINLTVKMISFAEFLKDYPAKFTGRRTLIIERIDNAKKTDHEGLRKERLTAISKDILQLKRDEQRAKKEALIQCLKAAETGRLVAELIRGYGTLSAEDMLVSIRSSLGFVAEISGMNPDVVSLLGKYNAVETAIREDPYWNALLDEKIIKEGG